VCYFYFLYAFYNVNYDAAYEDFRSGKVTLHTDMPYVLQQLSHNFYGIKFILKQCLIYVLVQKWNSPKWRWILIGWLSAEVTAAIVNMGARSGALLLILTAGIAYDRLVKPIKPLVCFSGGLLILCGFLLFGLNRDTRGGLSELRMGEIWSANSEFQALFGTAFDVHLLRGQLSAPWQVRCSELLLFIPSQLVPFDKMDGADWYLAEKGLAGRGIGLMFGVISQCVIGFDWIELVIRGGFVGWIFAAIHNWYTNRSGSFRANLLYIFICVWSYYTFRDTTLTIGYFVLYRLFPTILLLRLGQKITSPPATLALASK
jgi:hypothetical protein